MAASSSKNLPALMPSKAKSGTALVDEKIDEKILRLLGLEDVFDIDYDTYSSLLRERMAAARMANKTLPTEEVEMITNEWKRVKGKKGRFKVKKITASSFKKGSAVGINLKKQKLLLGAKPLALQPAKLDQSGAKSDIKDIISALGEIIKNLTLLNKNQKIADEKRRKESEAEKRGLAESALEKGFKGAIKVAEKIIAPIKSLLGRIIDYFTAIFLGRVVFKLLEWFGNPDNAEKVKSIGKFLGDHWPKLLSLYLLFGTQFGGFVRSLISLLVKGGAMLLKAALGLAAKAGLGKAGKFASFLGGKKGKLLIAGVEAATTVGATMALSSGIESFGGIGGDQKAQKFSGGGYVRPRMPGFSGGGFNFGGMMKGASLGAMFGPLGMLLAGALGSGKPQEMVGGFVSGEKGVDKIPAMLSDGEFVMSRGAVQKYGIDTLEAMNAAGGGTNKPRVVSGKTYAAGGGYVGADKSSDPAVKRNEQKLEEQKKKEATSGPTAMPKVSTSEDMNKLADKIRFEERLKRIEGQLQAKSALASGKGINIRGVSVGRNLGKGFATTYQGRDSIIIKDGAKFDTSTGLGDSEITLAGKRYFGQRKGNDVIYSVAKTGGALVGGSGLKKIDKKKLPPTQIMTDGKGGKPFIGFLTFEKGQPVYKRGAEPGTGTTNPMEALGRWLNPNAYKKSDQTAASKKMREGATNSLEYYRKRGMTEDEIKKQMKSLGQDYEKAKNDLEYRNKRPELLKQGKIDRQGKPLSAQQQMRAKIAATQKRSSTPSAPITPKVKVKVSNNRNTRGGGSVPSSGGKPKTPNFGATCPASNAPKNKKILGIF